MPASAAAAAIPRPPIVTLCIHTWKEQGRPRPFHESHGFNPSTATPSTLPTNTLPPPNPNQPQPDPCQAPHPCSIPSQLATAGTLSTSSTMDDLRMALASPMITPSTTLDDVTLAAAGPGKHALCAAVAAKNAAGEKSQQGGASGRTPAPRMWTNGRQGEEGKFDQLEEEDDLFEELAGWGRSRSAVAPMAAARFATALQR